MTSRRSRSLLAVALSLGFALTGASCGGDGPSGPPEPVPGEAVFTLAGAISGDRAVLLEIGPGATAVKAESTTVEMHAQPVRQGFLAAVFGPIQGEALLRISVPDLANLPTVTVREVADESGFLREDLSTYQTKLKKVR